MLSAMATASAPATPTTSPDTLTTVGERSSYLKMLSNIANDLDLLLTDLCQLYPYHGSSPSKQFYPFPGDIQRQEAHPYTGDSHGRSFTDIIGNSNLSLQSLSASDHTSTGDSGHDDKTQGSLSPQMPLYHVQDVGQGQQILTPESSPIDHMSDSSLRPVTLLERLSKTHSIWLLPTIGRTGAVHLLKDRETGSFVVRKSSQKNSLALSVQYQHDGQSNVDHYLIESTEEGMKLQGSAHFFRSIPGLIGYYILNQDELPNKLVLPSAILHAKSSQELSSLAMLGQDFWVSPISRHQNLVSLSCGAPLHKSCSEPINITRQFHDVHPELPAKTKNFVPSHSLGDFSKYMKNQGQKMQLVENAPVLPAKMDKKSKQTQGEISRVVSPTSNFYDHPVGAHVPHIQLNEDSHVTNGDVYRHEVVGYKQQVDLKSQTHPRASVRGKSSLYFTTSLDLLHIPEPSYFRSSLSDKMSDYEDIWKNSICESDNVQNNLKCNMWTQTRDSVGPLLSTVHNDFQEAGHSPVMGDSFPKDNVDKAVAMGSTRHHREEPNVSMSATSEQRVLVNSVPVTSTVTVNSHMISQNSAPKSKPPPIPTLSRIKSSSTSSLSTLASPIYAEPIDAVDLAGTNNRPVSVRIRRLSAPSGPSKGDKNSWQTRNSKPAQTGVSQYPQLETIFSPRVTKTFHSDGGQVFKFGPNRVQQSQHVKRKSGKGVSRSQSTRTSTEKEYKISRQRSLRERLSRLKIDVSSKQKASPSIDRNERLRGQSGQNDMLFSIEDLERNSTAGESLTLNKFPVYKKQISSETNRTSCFSDSSTVQDMISCALPEYTVRPIQPLTLNNVKRVSEYDNLLNSYAAPSLTASSVGTVFCKPWDNNPWEKLLTTANTSLQPAMDAKDRIQKWQEANQTFGNRDSSIIVNGDGRESVISESEQFLTVPHSNAAHRNRVASRQHKHAGHHPETCNKNVADSVDGNHVNTDSETVNDLSEDDGLISDEASQVINSDLRDRLRPIIVSQSSSHPTNSNNPGAKIRDYIFRLSGDGSTTFGCTIENFIQCTLESQETNPHHVMRNVRQFMSGIKNYLVKHGEGELEDLIERERRKLAVDEILNIDAIIEGALHVCVLRQVKHHIYRLFVEEHNKTGSLQLMVRNIKYARSKSPEEIGIKPYIKPPQGPDMELIKHYLDKMQKAYSPLKKLENLLSATSTIYQCVCEKHQVPTRGPASLGADDFLPMLIYVLVHCGLVSAEIEADYMWGLLHPSLLTGEGGYYLTTFSSAVLVLKNFQAAQESTASQHQGRLPSISDMQGFLKIAIPDELRDSIIWKTLPVRPNMNTKDICAMIAHKFKVTNPQDYGFYLLVSGEESQLADNLCPQMIKGEYLASGEDVVFAYKRLAANIAWPMNMKKPSAR